MTVTLTSSELSTFEGKLSEWYRNQFIYVLDNLWSRPDFTLDPRGRNVTEATRALMLKFEKENPRPDWRTLL